MPYFMKNQRIEHALFDDLLSNKDSSSFHLKSSVSHGCQVNTPSLTAT